MDSTKTKLRPYQKEAIDALDKHFRRNKVGCLVLPTGSGKTFTTWSFLKSRLEKGERVLCVVHREYLIPQHEKEIRKLCPDASITLWTADRKDASGDVVIAMVLSTKAIGDLPERERSFGWLVLDECHRGAAKSYAELDSRVLYKRKLGLTATPERLDNKELRLGQKPAYQAGFRELVEAGYLSKPIVRVIRTGQNIRYTTSGGDVSRNSLASIDQSKRNILLVRSLVRGMGLWKGTHTGERQKDTDLDKSCSIHRTDKTVGCLDNPGRDNEEPLRRRCLIFACDVEHVRRIVEDINRLCGEGTARGLHGRVPKSERKKVLQEFGSVFPILVNCEIFTEGHDDPHITDIVIARPVISKSLWVQMVGRGARIIPGIKDSFNLWILLDDISKFAWLVKEWTLQETGKDELEDIPSKKQQETRIKEACRKLNVDVPSLADKLVATGIIRTSGLYDGTGHQTHIMTRDREQCLELFARSLSSARSNIKDHIDESYGSCVLAGEFSITEWRSMAWAWVTSQNGKSTNNHGMPIWQEEWINRSTFDNAYLSDVETQSLKLCKLFNDTAKHWVGHRGAAGILERWKSLEIPQKSRWILSKITGISMRNRCVIIKTSLPKFSHSIRGLTLAIREYMREELNDDNIIVTLRLAK